MSGEVGAGSAGSDTGGSSSGGGSNGATGSPDSGAGGALPQHVEGRGGEPGKERELGADGKPKPEAPRYKTKRGGKDVELAGEELARMLSDDFEHEFPGPGGKPAKLNWKEMIRHAQMGLGFTGRMQQLKQRQDQWEQEVEHGKKDVPAFLEGRLGVENHREWAYKIAKEDYELQCLLVSDKPGDREEYNRRIQERAKSDLARKESIAKAVEQQRIGQERERQRNINLTREVAAVLKDNGVPVNKTTQRIARELIDEYARHGHKLTRSDVVDMTRKAYFEEIHGVIDALDADGYVKFFGDDRRRKFLEYEREAAKGKERDRSQERRDAARESQQNGQRQQERKGLTEAELKRKYSGR